MNPRTVSSYFFLLLLVSYGKASAQHENPLIAAEFDQQKRWVDSIYGQMSLQEKVGQLIMAEIPEGDSADEVRDLIQEHHLGGVVFGRGGPRRQARLINEFQEVSAVPLLIGTDPEWDVSRSRDSTFAFPKNLTLGAIEDLNLIQQAGAAISRNSKRLGVHLNFTPVVDIYTNPRNPKLSSRSFGEDKENVHQKSLAFMKGMQRENMLSSGRRFPVTEDHSMDSYQTLPTVNFTRARLDSVELYPYRKLIEEGLTSVMVGHLDLPDLNRSELPASLSEAVVTDLLKEDLGFRGLVITDVLNRGPLASREPGEVGLAAFLAGNDILLMPESVSETAQALIGAFNRGLITEERLNHSVRKILFAKFKVGLDQYNPVDTSYLVEELNNVRNEALNHQLYENSLTLIKNRSKIVPVRDLVDRRIAYVNFGDGDAHPFYDQLNKYTKVDWIKSEHLNDLIQELESYDLVVLGYHRSDEAPQEYQFSDKELVWLFEIARNNRVVLNIFTRPAALLPLVPATNFEGILVGYQNHPLAQEKAAQLIFGAVEARGKLPVGAGKEFPAGTGIETKSLDRLSYGIPETVGVNSYKLRKIDSLIQVTLEKEMAPGVQVLVARKGKVIYNKSAGYHTYEKKIPVSETDIYDIASLTKIIGTLPLVMELVDKDELDLETRLPDILPSFVNSNKKTASLQAMLSHYARFKSWIPFHRYTFDSETRQPSPEYYRKQSGPGFSIKVAEDLFIRNDFRDSVVQVIRNSEMEKRLEYRYSDLPYYLLKAFLEKTYGTSLDYLTREHIFEPMGANYTTYLPLNHFPKEQIVPTEDDKTWRNQLLRGYVHDEGAATLGGIAGHAGIFSNTNDIAKMMQMYLNGGTYGGRRFFSQETFDRFNTCYYCDKDVRRGVGFDKPQLEEKGPTCGCVSMSSFGHSGFTGTFTWADPHEEIVYVFLSNRIHPSVTNNKLGEESIRSKIQEVIYQAIDY